MTIRLECPGCQRTLRVPDQYAGRSAKCPGCAAKLTIPSAGTTDDNPFGFAPAGEAMIGSVSGRAVDVPAEDDQRVSAELDRLRKLGGWQSVAGGLNNIWMGTGLQVLGMTTVVLVASLLVGVVTTSAMVATDGEAVPKPRLEQISSVVTASCMVLFVLGGTVLRLIGFFRCLATPRPSGAWVFALLALGCELLLLAGALVAAIGPLVSPMLSVAGNTLFTLAGLPGLVFLLLYLRRIGVALGARAIPARVMHFVYWLIGGGIIGLPVLLGIGFGMVAVAGSQGRGSPLAYLGCCGFLLLPLALVGIPLTLLIKYLGTISLVAEEVRKRTSRFWY